MRTCVFCGRDLAGVASREHVFQHWLLNGLEIREKEIPQTHFPRKDGSALSTRKQTLNGLVAGRICEPCNTGWMSNLESAAKPLLLKLCSNDTLAIRCEQPDKLLLARWAMKTAIVLNLASNFHKNIP